MTTAAKTPKAPNYSAEQTAQILAGYTPTADQATREKQVADLAQALGRTVRSIVAKLSREKVYIAKTYETKTGEKPVKKDEHADAIGAVLRLTEPEIESLTKANKTALAKIFGALASSKPVDGVTLSESESATLAKVSPEDRADAFAMMAEAVMMDEAEKGEAE